jgi:hypothetical protein
MKGLKSLSISLLLATAAATTIAIAYEKTNHSQFYLCRHSYALCTSALCVPQPGNPEKAICFCDVEEGASMATVPCKNLSPTVDSHGVRTIYSTFSLKQFKNKKAMRCPEGKPWTWCLNKICTVDPTNSSKAICLCDVMMSDEWVTFGGDCDTKTCETSYWSGAHLKDLSDGNLFMVKSLRLDKSPLQWCPSY